MNECVSGALMKLWNYNIFKFCIMPMQFIDLFHMIIV
jgi:hypothetical protein